MIETDHVVKTCNADTISQAVAGRTVLGSIEAISKRFFYQGAGFFVYT